MSIAMIFTAIFIALWWEVIFGIACLICQLIWKLIEGFFLAIYQFIITPARTEEEMKKFREEFPDWKG